MYSAQTLSFLCVGLVTAGITWAQSSPSNSVVTKSIRAVSYPVGGGSTKIDLRSTSLVPQAAGEATVQANQGVTKVEVAVTGLVEPSRLGTEFLTYVLWVVSPEGRFSNVGEIQVDTARRGKLNGTTPL